MRIKPRVNVDGRWSQNTVYSLPGIQIVQMLVHAILDVEISVDGFGAVEKVYPWNSRAYRPLWYYVGRRSKMQTCEEHRLFEVQRSSA